MRRGISGWWAPLLVAATLGWAACSGPAATPDTATGENPPQTSDLSWKSTCLEGTIQAVQMEITRYTGWLAEADEEQSVTYRQALDYLQTALQTYKSMPPEKFDPQTVWRYIPGVTMGTYGRESLPPTPESIVLEDAWLETDGLLHYEGMSRSGPFYTLVAPPPMLQLGVHYRMEIRLLMPVSYPFPSFYVCLRSFEPLK